MCSLCEVGAWCAQGVSTPCPTGSSSPTNSSRQNQCQCIAGYFGDGTVVGTSPCAYCWAGYYCEGGGVSRLCPPNSTSPSGSFGLLFGLP